ncbi:MAG: cytochrome c biogenesis protein CcdA, partial [Chloroflexota bacterium]
MSFTVAFAGGALAILSPCSALLLPSFFATAFASRTRLLLQAPLFFAGIATVVVPLGLGIGAVSELVLGQRDLVVAIAGAVLVGFGLYTLAGGG